MTDQIDTATLRALAEAATKGPWEAYTVPQTRTEAPYIAVEVGETEVRIARFEGGHYDAAFIAAARTAVPALLDEVERLRAEVDVEYGAAQMAAGDRDEALGNLTRCEAERDDLAAQVERVRALADSWASSSSFDVRLAAKDILGALIGGE